MFNNAVAAGDANERREQGLAVPKGGSKPSLEASWRVPLGSDRDDRVMDPIDQVCHKFVPWPDDHVDHARKQQ